MNNLTSENQKNQETIIREIMRKKPDNKSNPDQKARGLMRKIMCVAISFIVFGTYSFCDPWQAYAANTQPTVNQTKQAYKWERAYSTDDLLEKMQKAAGQTTEITDRTINNDDYWVRALIVYKSGDTYYYLGSNGLPGSGYDGYPATILSNSFGIDVNDDTFETSSGLNALYIKRTKGGQRSDYDKFQPQFSLRFCVSGTEKMSDYLVGMHLRFYGVKYHAITNQVFDFTEKKDFSGGKSKPKKYASSAHYESVNIKFNPSWKTFFTNYNVTEKQKNVLMYIYNYRICHYYGSKSEGTYWQESMYNEYGHTYPVVYEGYNYSTYGSYSYRYYTYPSVAERVSAALKNCTDTSKYDLSVLTKVYKPTDQAHKQYAYGVSGADAYNYLFKDTCKEYQDSNKSDRADEGTAYFYYDFDCDIYERNWKQNGAWVNIVDGDTSNTSFMIWIGTPIQNHSGDITESYTIAPGRVEVWNSSTEIGYNVEVRVEKGATLIIQGHVHNNGSIHVHGGTLIVAGVLDCTEDAKTKYYASSSFGEFAGKYGNVGSVYIQSGSVLHVEKTGAMLNRIPSSALYIVSSSAVVEGVIVSGDLRISDNATLRGMPGSVIIAKAVTNSGVSIDAFNAELLYKYKDYKLNQLVSLASYIKDDGYYFVLARNSSLVSRGLVATTSYNLTIDDTSYCYYWGETDLKRTVAQGMLDW